MIACFNLTYHTTLGDCLHREEYEKLIHAYILSIKHIKQLYKNFQVSQAFIEIFEFQYKNFIFFDDLKLGRIVRNPWTLVPIYEEKYADQIPEILRVSDSPMQQLKDQIQRFLTLAHLINKLSSSTKVFIFEDYPFKFEGRDVYTWEIDDTIVVDEEKTLVR